jgi:hypothetical protein
VLCVNLTDDELWCAIAANTDAMADLLDQRAEVAAEISILSDPAQGSDLMNSYVDTVDKIETEYRTYTAELRRRYPS